MTDKGFGKVKSNRDDASKTPYDRLIPASLYGRVKLSIRDRLAPHWLRDALTFIKDHVSKEEYRVDKLPDVESSAHDSDAKNSATSSSVQNSRNEKRSIVAGKANGGTRRVGLSHSDADVGETTYLYNSSSSKQLPPSQVVQRVLKAMQDMSSPLRDAKKIPLLPQPWSCGHSPNARQTEPVVPKTLSGMSLTSSPQTCEVVDSDQSHDSRVRSCSLLPCRRQMPLSPHSPLSRLPVASTLSTEASSRGQIKESRTSAPPDFEAERSFRLFTSGSSFCKNSGAKGVSCVARLQYDTPDKKTSYAVTASECKAPASVPSSVGDTIKEVDHRDKRTATLTHGLLSANVSGRRAALSSEAEDDVEVMRLMQSIGGGKKRPCAEVDVSSPPLSPVTCRRQLEGSSRNLAPSAKRARCATPPPPPASWLCDTCLTQNTGAVTRCFACRLTRPDALPPPRAELPMEAKTTASSSPWLSAWFVSQSSQVVPPAAVAPASQVRGAACNAETVRKEDAVPLAVQPSDSNDNGTSEDREHDLVKAEPAASAAVFTLHDVTSVPHSTDFGVAGGSELKRKECADIYATEQSQVTSRQALTSCEVPLQRSAAFTGSGREEPNATGAPTTTSALTGKDQPLHTEEALSASAPELCSAGFQPHFGGLAFDLPPQVSDAVSETETAGLPAQAIDPASVSLFTTSSVKPVPASFSFGLLPQTAPVQSSGFSFGDTLPSLSKPSIASSGHVGAITSFPMFSTPPVMSSTLAPTAVAAVTSAAPPVAASFAFGSIPSVSSVPPSFLAPASTSSMFAIAQAPMTSTNAVPAKLETAAPSMQQGSGVFFGGKATGTTPAAVTSLFTFGSSLAMPSSVAGPAVPVFAFGAAAAPAAVVSSAGAARKPLFTFGSAAPPTTTEVTSAPSAATGQPLFTFGATAALTAAASGTSSNPLFTFGSSAATQPVSLFNLEGAAKPAFNFGLGAIQAAAPLPTNGASKQLFTFGSTAAQATAVAPLVGSKRSIIDDDGADTPDSKRPLSFAAPASTFANSSGLTFGGAVGQRIASAGGSSGAFAFGTSSMGSAGAAAAPAAPPGGPFGQFAVGPAAFNFGAQAAPPGGGLFNFGREATGGGAVGPSATPGQLTQMSQQSPFAFGAGAAALGLPGSNTMPAYAGTVTASGNIFTAGSRPVKKATRRLHKK